MSAAAPLALDDDAASRLPAARLQAIVKQIVLAAGADAAAAGMLAKSLVGSDLRGVSSHGFMRVPEYLTAIRAGRIVPSARPKVAARRGAAVAIDGALGFGQVAARELAPQSVALAREHGVGLVTLRGVTHVGRLGEWVERTALGGCVALAWCAGGEPFGNVVPFGARERRLGTHPIAYAVPAARGAPLVSDFSTSAVAEGKVRLYRHAGRSVPAGWLLDAHGEPSEDPASLYQGGAILPMGAHKGFALALLTELLGGVLSGAGCVSLGESPGNGVTLIAIDPARVGDGAGGFGVRVEQVLASIASAAPARGSERVMLPGEPERQALRERRRNGIPFALQTWASLLAAAADVGVELAGDPAMELDRGARR